MSPCGMAGSLEVIQRLSRDGLSEIMAAHRASDLKEIGLRLKAARAKLLMALEAVEEYLRFLE